MNKKMYQKPAMKVVKLQYNTQLLAVSSNSTRTDYGDANTSVDPDELNDQGDWEWN